MTIMLGLVVDSIVIDVGAEVNLSMMLQVRLLVMGSAWRVLTCCTINVSSVIRHDMPD